MSKPELIWLLDFDGVINAKRPLWGSAPFAGHINDEKGVEYRVRWAPKLVRAIAELNATGLVDIQWATTWSPAVANIEAKLNLPPLGNAIPRNPGDPEWEPPAWNKAKLAAAMAVVDAGKILIWTDDIAVPVYGNDYEHLTARPGQALLIRPDSHNGLTPDHMEQISAFVQAAQFAAHHGGAL